MAIDVEAGVERRHIERQRPIGGRQRIDRDQAFGRAVEAGRMIGAGALAEIDRDRPRGRRRRREGAEAVEHAGRRHHLDLAAAGAAGAGGSVVGGGGGAGERDDAPEHVDEGAGQRQVGPAGVGGDVEQHEQPLAAALGGDQRRAVGERRPGAVGEQRIRLRQHLPRHGDVVGHRHAVERAVARETGEVLRLVPAQAAAEDAAAAAQLHRHQIVVFGGGEMRAGEAHQHAAIVDPLVETLARLGDIADVGEDQHRQALVEEARHRFRRPDAFGEADIGERIERAREIIGRAQQRLRAVGGRAGHDADGAAAPALVEQLHGAGRMLADDLQPRHVVADFDRQVDHRLGLARVGLERERRLAERQALEVDGADQADVGAAGLRAQHLHRQRAGGVVGGGQRMRNGDAAGHDGERVAADDALASPRRKPRPCRDRRRPTARRFRHPWRGQGSARSAAAPRRGRRRAASA